MNRYQPLPCRTVSLLFALFLLFGNQNLASGQNEIHLNTMRPVTGSLAEWGRKFSIADHIYTNGLHGDTGWHSDPGFAVYDLRGRFTRLEGWIGVRDDNLSTRDKKFRILLDGREIMAGDASSGDLPQRVEIDITGGHALRVALDVGVTFADAYVVERQRAYSPTQIGSQNGAVGTRRSISLTWLPIAGAVSYGVEIVCTKGLTPRIYSLNSRTNSAVFDTTTVPNGNYHWSVIAFDRFGSVGKFTKGNSFSLRY